MGLAGRRDRLAFLVFAVGEDDDRLVGVRLGEERVRGRVDRVAQPRAAAADVVRTDLVERLLEIVIMGGERNLLLHVAGKDDQPHAVARHVVDHVFDLLLGPFEPVGRGVFGQHRPRHVEHEHHFDALLRHFAPHLAPADVDQRHDHQRHRGGDQRRAERAAEAAGGRQARRDQVGRGELRSRAAPGRRPRRRTRPQRTAATSHSQFELAQVAELNVHDDLHVRLILLRQIRGTRCWSSSTCAASSRNATSTSGGRLQAPTCDGWMASSR